ncbi:hypothetical protein ACFQ15_05705 [Sphingomonas hankookensis]|uniref:hypothetical protein n=1 Tax=Sphingomonas hankookensis TaxID=563996 RepID=UPI001F55C5FF|nr:hypothetical protein [Sphingomonas hankookensis]
MSTEPSSLMRAVQDEAGAAAVAGVETTAEQLDLLRDPESGRLPANVFQLVREQEAKRGRGRPAGARNRKSDQLAKIIVQKYGDPVEGMAALYAMPLDQLVEMLLVADGSRERQDHLDTLLARTDELFDRMSASASDDTLEKLSTVLDRVADVARQLKSKPGELALKALNTQLLARREVGPYVHGKMPIQVDHSHRADVILNIPGLTDSAHLAEYVENGELSEDALANIDFAQFEDVGPDAD